MLSWVRKLRGNWVARIFIAALALIFVFWGVSNVLTLMSSSTNVAHVGGVPIDISVVQAEYETGLNQAEQAGQDTSSAAARQALANRALSGVLRQEVLKLAEQRLGVVAPDAAIRQAIDAIPAFQTNGAFDQAKFNQVLAQNNLTPDRFIDEVKADIADRQLMIGVVAGAAAPAALVNQIFGFVAEQRVAETVSIPFAGEPAPPVPPDAVLQRYWRNHPTQFTSPETRKIQLVILSPTLLAPREAVNQADVDAAYARLAAGQPTVPLRSVQVLLVPDLAASSRLEVAWKHGASWSEMQAMAKKFGATSVALDQAQQKQIPSAALAQAVFAASPGEVEGPVPGLMGMFVFKVTDVGSSGPDPEDAKREITQQLQLQEAQADVAQDVDSLQDALAGQTPLDQLPGNLGLVALQGTLDANGNAPDGTPAPIPGGDALKAVIVKAAFAAAPHAPAQLMNGPDGSYFALTVSAVIPPSQQPYDQVAAKVLSAWTQAQLQRAAEVQAADLLAAVSHGQSFDAAASAAGLAVAMSAPVTRNAPASGVISQMVPVLFSLKQGEATMQQTATGFTVAVLAKIIDPTPAQDPAEYAQVQQAMTKALQNDLGESFLIGLQARDKVSVDQKLLTQLYQ